ncbi:helix-turn-helix transcriptional regulator [Rhizobiaceae bacterium n13]|uniref:ATP-binding protein n=1 Tax=Ferirhizobium litorale TaxID=2927786 RepID=UPI0024B2C485|nr:winged helix-turn-helix domain-containing protein [Fererhizobium litorale]MDI7862851.1 helix-turn-helix transcriptional regulator [Fererhizobium litorale]
MGDQPRNGTFGFGPYRLNPTARILFRGDDVLAVGSRAFDILVALVQNHGQVVSQRELMAFAWPGLHVEESNVRVQMTHLRREIRCGENGNRYIASIAGRGYSFVAPVEWQDAPEAHEALHALWGDDKAPRMASSSTAAYSLSPHANPPIGREENISELAHMIGERRFVTIVGAGGVGKTTLATFVARELSMFQRMYFVDLSTIDDEAAVLQTVAAVLETNGSISDIVGQLSAKRALVILDNCEHLIDAVAGIVGPLLGQTEDTHILATSRESFRSPGEAVYLLRPLGVPPNTGRLTAAQVLPWPAIRLFVERAVDGGYLGPIGDEQAVMIATICRRLDGNPLAIELVASRVGAYGLERVAELLDNQLALRWRGNRHATPRHQTAEAMMDWSYALLSETDQQLFRRLSVFSGEFSLDAAIEIAEDGDLGRAEIVESIGNLIDKSLLTINTGAGPAQLKLSGIARTYAAFKLLASGEHPLIDQRQSLRHAQPLQRRRAIFSTDSAQAVQIQAS